MSEPSAPFCPKKKARQKVILWCSRNKSRYASSIRDVPSIAVVEVRQQPDARLARYRHLESVINNYHANFSSKNVNSAQKVKFFIAITVAASAAGKTDGFIPGLYLPPKKLQFLCTYFFRFFSLKKSWKK